MTLQIVYRLYYINYVVKFMYFVKARNLKITLYILIKLTTLINIAHSYAYK